MCNVHLETWVEDETRPSHLAQGPVLHHDFVQSIDISPSYFQTQDSPKCVDLEMQRIEKDIAFGPILSFGYRLKTPWRVEQRDISEISGDVIESLTREGLMRRERQMKKRFSIFYFFSQFSLIPLLLVSMTSSTIWTTPHPSLFIV